MTRPDHAVSLREAARALDVDVSTLRRWIQRGAPTVNGPGEVGRGNGSEVDPEAVRRWKDGTPATLDLEALAVALWDVLRRDQADALTGITERQCAGVLVLVFDRMFMNLTHQAPDLATLPARVRQLLECANARFL